MRVYGNSKLLISEQKLIVYNNMPLMNLQVVIINPRYLIQNTVYNVVHT